MASAWCAYQPRPQPAPQARRGRAPGRLDTFPCGGGEMTPAPTCSRPLSRQRDHAGRRPGSCRGHRGGTNSFDPAGAGIAATPRHTARPDRGLAPGEEFPHRSHCRLRPSGGHSPVAEVAGPQGEWTIADQTPTTTIGDARRCRHGGVGAEGLGHYIAWRASEWSVKSWFQCVPRND